MTFYSTCRIIASTYQQPIKPEEHQEVNLSPPGLRGSQQSRMQADWRQSQPTAPDRNSYWLHFSCSLLQYNATYCSSSTLRIKDTVPFDVGRAKCCLAWLLTLQVRVLLKLVSVTLSWTPVPFIFLPPKTSTQMIHTQTIIYIPSFFTLFDFSIFPRNILIQLWIQHPNYSQQTRLYRSNTSNLYSLY